MSFCAVMPAAAIAPAAAADPGLPSDWHRGANVTSWSPSGFERPPADSALGDLHGAGATHAAIVVTWYMDDRASNSVAPRADKTPTDQSVIHAIERAKALGLRVMLKPHVDVWDGTFRGDIAPASRAAWWASYRAMIAHYADLAASAGVDILAVGTELTSMSSDESEWRAIISDARSRFDGALTFGANWVAGAERIAFWRELDYIGIDAYMPLSDGDPNPPVEALERAWHERGYVAALERLHRAHDRPVIFTELGYQSRLGTAVTPWWTPEGEISQEPQQRAYEAAFRVWSRVPWFKGIYWWDWSADGYNHHPDDGWFRFGGKLAEATVRAWYTAPPITLSPEPSPPPPPTPAAEGGERLDGVSVLVLVRGAKRRRFKLRPAEGLPRACLPRVTVRLARWNRTQRRWRRHGSIVSRRRGQSVYVASLRRLRSGSYRARAVLSGSGCIRARSKAATFDVRA